jgi:hypothetical protein
MTMLLTFPITGMTCGTVTIIEDGLMLAMAVITLLTI